MKIDETKSRKPTDGLYRKRDTSVLGSKFSLYSSSNKEELYHVDINKIKEFEGQARRHFDEEPIRKLADSIKEHGIRAPLTLLRRSEDILEVVSGERRLRAAKLAGLKKVPAFILDDVKKAEILSVIENVQREDLHPLEFAIACKRLLEEKVYKNISELAENIGVARTSISESLGLVDLPFSIKEYIIQNKIDNRVILRKLKRAGSENQCKKILNIDQKQEKADKNINEKTFSILRLKLDNGKILIETNKVPSLTNTQKEELKSLVNKIIE